ncbi:MAG TPA: hypothetical protein VFT99_09615 [Roseiflexaceae bacterium]|nr:hypothetical protein [Roseiflexaceae bacterium]
MTRTSMPFPGQGRSEEPEWTVWLTVLICLVLGWLLMTTVVGRTHTQQSPAGSIAYPQNWVPAQEEGAAFAATDIDAGPYGSRVIIRQVPKSDLITALGPDTLQTAASSWTVLRSRDLEGYRVLRIEPTTVGGRDAVEVEYAYITDPPEGTAGGVIPAVMHGIDTVVASGDQFSIFSVVVDQNGVDDVVTLNERLRSSWQAP